MKSNCLKDKVILVTGASSGIGAAAAQEFGRAGAKVALAARRREKLDEIASRMKDALAIPVDLGEEGAAREMVRKTIEHYGRIDVLVSNAASIIVTQSETVSGEDLLKAFRTNLLASVSAIQEALHFMRHQGSGHIIVVGSPGFMMGIPYYAPYVCSKAALSAWTRTIQAEWDFPGITVSEYFPGYIKTDSLPESRIGSVEQDFLMAPARNFISRYFTRPKTPEQVAGQLARLIRKPKPIAYSDAGTRIGAVISNFPGFRLAIARQMAQTARKKKNLKH